MKMILGSGAFVAALALAQLSVYSQPVPVVSAPDAFWAELKKHCGKAYAGSVAAAPADDTTFKNKTLLMHVRSCERLQSAERANRAPRSAEPAYRLFQS